MNTPLYINNEGYETCIQPTVKSLEWTNLGHIDNNCGIYCFKVPPRMRLIRYLNHPVGEVDYVVTAVNPTDGFSYCQLKVNYNDRFGMRGIDE